MSVGEILDELMSQPIPDDGRPLINLVCEFSDSTDSDGEDWWGDV